MNICPVKLFAAVPVTKGYTNRKGFRLTKVHGAVLTLALPTTTDPPTLPTIPCRGIKVRTGEVGVRSLCCEAESLTVR